jgi:histidinol-phosphate aminotransferase
MNELKDIIEDGGVMIFIDEAYAEFSSKNLLDLAQYSNVILARTFSKAFGLANLRIGYAVIPEELRKYFLKVSTPFPLSTPAKQAAIAALDDREYLKMVVDRTVAERETMLRELKKMGVRAFPSESNFIFIETEFDSAYMVEELLKRGIIIRDCSGFTGCNSNHVRVSVGKKEENDMFLEAMGEIY